MKRLRYIFVKSPFLSITYRRLNYVSTKWGKDQPNAYIIANVLQPTTSKGPGGGHNSPLAAYNIKTNKVLFLDVSRYELTPSWIDMKVLYKEMNTKDDSSKKSRGFLVVSK